MLAGFGALIILIIGFYNWCNGTPLKKDTGMQTDDQVETGMPTAGLTGDNEVKLNTQDLRERRGDRQAGAHSAQDPHGEVEDHTRDEHEPTDFPMLERSTLLKKGQKNPLLSLEQKM